MKLPWRKLLSKSEISHLSGSKVETLSVRGRQTDCKFLNYFQAGTRTEVRERATLAMQFMALFL